MSEALKRPAQILTLVLAGLCALLLLILASQRMFAGGDGDIVQVAPNKGAQTGGLETGGFKLPPLQEFAVVVQRPLFNETRRPVAYDDGAKQEAQAENKPVVKKDLPKIQLTGVIITPDARFAMIRDVKDNKFYALQEGAPLDGWTVQSIAPRRVVLASGSGEQVVELAVYTGGGGGSAGAAVAGQPAAQSAADLIRQRIERERERRRALIEAARKRQEAGG